MQVWVKLHLFPMDFSNNDSLKDIGKNLGKFIMSDDSYKTESVRSISKILVEIDVSIGLHESIVFDLGCFKKTQTLYYGNVPFRHVIFHVYVHLVSDYSKTFIYKFWREKNPKDSIFYDGPTQDLGASPLCIMPPERRLILF